jgi:hypothetical protein
MFTSLNLGQATEINRVDRDENTAIIKKRMVSCYPFGLREN